MSEWHDEVVRDFGQSVPTFDYAASRRRIKALEARVTAMWRAKWFMACERVFGSNVPPAHRRDDVVLIRNLKTGRSHVVDDASVEWDSNDDALSVLTTCGRFLSESEYVAIDAIEAPMCERCARHLAKSLVDA